jgi:NAD(P)H dehydrogenase (quinone)
MIVVTGATGKLGKLIIGSLLHRLPASEIGISVREPQGASVWKASGMQVRHGDFSQPDTLTAAFEGATALLIISSNAAAFGGDPIAQHRAAIEAAKQVGVERVLYTSHAAASMSSAFPPMRVHAYTEMMLSESGLEWIALRNGFYADAALRFLGDWKRGIVRAPVDGKVGWTAHEDLAEAAAAVLTSQAGVSGPTPPLTGSEALDFADLTAIAGALLREPVHRQVVDDEVYRKELEDRGLSLARINMTFDFYRASRLEEFSVVDRTLERLIGRKPKTMREVLSEAQVR